MLIIFKNLHQGWKKKKLCSLHPFHLLHRPAFHLSAALNASWHRLMHVGVGNCNSKLDEVGSDRDQPGRDLCLGYSELPGLSPPISGAVDWDCCFSPYTPLHSLLFPLSWDSCCVVSGVRTCLPAQFENWVSLWSFEAQNEVRALRVEARTFLSLIPLLRRESSLICPVFTFSDLTLGIVPYWVMSFGESFYVSFSKTTVQLAPA